MSRAAISLATAACVALLSLATLPANAGPPDPARSTSVPPAPDPARAVTPDPKAAVLQGTPVPTAPLATTRALARAMAKSRAAQASLNYSIPDPLGGSPQPGKGIVRLESPDRVRLELTTTGEVVALRNDGGEWLQPNTHQLLRISSERAAGALQWWRLLLPESHTIFKEDSLGGLRYRLTPLGEDAGGVSVVARLAVNGLPAELTVHGLGDTPVSYRLSGWKFSAARGPAAYKLEAPPGYEVVDLP